MPIEGLPLLPEVWFWSGDRAYCLRDEPITRYGVPYKRLYLILTEQIMWRYGINDEKLNYDLSEYGVYIKEYPVSHFNLLTGNPEAPVIFMTCNFDGTESFGETLVDDKNKIGRLNKLTADLRDENRRLAEQLKIAHQQLRVLSGVK